MSTLHKRLRAEVERRMEVARAASGDTWVTGRSRGFQFSRPGDVYAIAHDGTPARIAEGTRCGPDISAEQSSEHIALSDPADAILAGEWALSVLQRHQPGYYATDCAYCELTSHDGDPMFRDWPCNEIRDLAKRYSVVVEE